MALIDCPDCGSKVSDMASSCPKCARPIHQPSHFPASTAAPSEVKPTETVGMMMVLVPIIATILFWGWVPSIPLFQASSTLNLFAVSTVIITAVLAVYEASQLRMGAESDRTPSGIRRSGPMEWFIGLIAMWIVGYPAYLARRSCYGLKNFGLVGFLVAVAFVGSYWLVGSMLSDQWAMVTRTTGR